MDVIDQIKKLASDGVDLVLQKMDTKRIGAEAERRNLFEAWMRNASNETLAGLLRERKALCAQLTDAELENEFERRELWSDKTAERRRATMTEIADNDKAEEKARVQFLAIEIAELAEKL